MNQRDTINIIQYLDWDTSLLGIPSGLIDLRNHEICHPKEFHEQIFTSLKQNNEFEFVTIKLNRMQIPFLNSLIKSGAVLIDTEITYIYSKPAKPSNSDTGNFSFQFCHQTDSTPFTELAEAMTLSRFYVDANIGAEKAINIWTESIKNHCNGHYADELLVAYHKAEPCGLVTIKKNSPQIFLHVVGVLKKWRQQGIASMMISEVAKKFSENHNIFVETQSRNLIAQHTYQSNGFMFDHTSYILHWWINKNCYPAPGVQETST